MVKQIRVDSSRGKGEIERVSPSPSTSACSIGRKEWEQDSQTKGITTTPSQLRETGFCGFPSKEGGVCGLPKTAAVHYELMREADHHAFVPCVSLADHEAEVKRLQKVESEQAYHIKKTEERDLRLADELDGLAEDMDYAALNRIAKVLRGEKTK